MTSVGTYAAAEKAAYEGPRQAQRTCKPRAECMTLCKMAAMHQQPGLSGSNIKLSKQYTLMGIIPERACWLMQQCQRLCFFAEHTRRTWQHGPHV